MPIPDPFDAEKANDVCAASGMKMCSAPEMCPSVGEDSPPVDQRLLNPGFEVVVPARHYTNVCSTATKGVNGVRTEVNSNGVTTASYYCNGERMEEDGRCTCWMENYHPTVYNQLRLNMN